MEQIGAIAVIGNFMKSRVILTAAELNLFTHLHERPSTAKDLAEKLKLDTRATNRLLDTLVNLDLIKKQNTCYYLTDSGLLLSAHHPETVLPFVLHHNNLWNSWSHLTEIVRNGPNPNRKPFFKRGEEDQKAFIEAMHVIGRKLSRKIADAYDSSAFKRLLDIGGGSGTYTIAFLQKNPQLKAVIFELKGIIPLAEERIRAEGISDRVEFVGGDFYKDELPQGCDLALLSAIIHQNSPEKNLDLYRKTFWALNPGGAVLIRDYIMYESRTNPPEGALFALNMLISTPGGDTYTFPEVKETLEKAGFTEVNWLRTGIMMDSLVEARKPF